MVKYIFDDSGLNNAERIVYKYLESCYRINTNILAPSLVVSKLKNNRNIPDMIVDHDWLKFTQRLHRADLDPASTQTRACSLCHLAFK